MAPRRKHVSLVADVAQSIDLDGAGTGVEVVSHGDDAIYFTTDGSTATVQGDNTFTCQARGYIRVPGRKGVDGVTVSVVSASNQDVSLEVT